MSKLSSLTRLSTVVLLVLMMAASASFFTFADSTASGSVTAYDLEELDDYLQSGYDNISLGNASWTTSKTISIPAGVTLDLNGQTVTSSVSYAFRLAGDGSSIKNGTIKGGGIKVNANDPSGVISGISVTNASQHGIWVYDGTIGAVKSNKITTPSNIGICIQGGKVAGNISGNTVTGSKDSSHGSIQLSASAAVSGRITGNTIKNGKCMGLYIYSKSKCGAIDNNVITGCASHAIRLAGNSSASSNDGSSAGDIAYNTITSCKGHGISLYNGSHCGKITHNSLKSIGGATSTGDFAIIVNAGSCYETYASEITYNTIDGVATAGIVAFSGPYGKSTKAYQDFGCVKGDIAYNTVSNNATQKKKVNWKKPKKTDPACEGAIYVDCHARVYGSIHDNTIDTSYDDGINVLAYSSVKGIYNNTVKNVRNAGIAVKNNSSAAKIYNNKITKAGRYGIFVNSSSKVTKIYKNTITKPAETGLAVLQKSKVSAFTKNTVTNAGLYGILAGGSGSKIANVSGNTISTNNKKAGYPVFCNSKCLITKITGNTITGKYLAGIRIKKPSGKIRIVSNKLVCKSPSSSSSAGMSIDGCGNKTITITSNKITGNGKGPGIRIKSSKSSVKKNKFKKVSQKIS